MDSLISVSSIDGRYKNITNKLSQYFSEYALFKYRVYVEIEVDKETRLLWQYIWEVKEKQEYYCD